MIRRSQGKQELVTSAYGKTRPNIQPGCKWLSILKPLGALECRKGKTEIKPRSLEIGKQKRKDSMEKAQEEEPVMTTNEDTDSHKAGIHRNTKQVLHTAVRDTPTLKPPQA